MSTAGKSRDVGDPVQYVAYVLEGVPQIRTATLVSEGTHQLCLARDGRVFFISVGALEKQDPGKK
jgi:hypothetical protein